MKALLALISAWIYLVVASQASVAALVTANQETPTKFPIAL